MWRKLLTTQIVISAITVGCQAATATSLPSNPTSVSSSEVLTTSTALQETSTKQIANPTPGVKENLSYLEEINSGKYLLVQTYEAGVPYLIFINPNKKIEKKVSEDAFFWSTSNDGNKLLIMGTSSEHARLFNLLTKTWTDLNIESECYEANSSPDGNIIAISCGNGSTLDIYILDVQLDSMVKITDCLEKDFYCDDPSWSFDGEWLAYSRNEVKSGTLSPENGVYVFNTNCIHDNNCMERQIGPINSDSNPTWSEENFLIVSKDGNIQFYDVRNRPSILVEEIMLNTTNATDIYSSPAGMYLVYAPAGNKIIYMAELVDNKLVNSEILLEGENITIVGWLVIP
jgi:WD40 repeat protein